MTHRVYNFSAGPATLPPTVLEEAQQHLLSYPGAGVSVLEMSHRSSRFEAIMAESEANLRQLLAVPDHYHVLFLQGGASLQFSMAALNFLRGHGGSAAYLVTGSWAQKALQAAENEGAVRVAWSGVEESFTRIPRQDELDLDPHSAYVHLTSNETIQGIQFRQEPDVGDVPLFCDASSDFLSRPLDIERYGLLYAGAQKNAGPAGVTLVILRDDLLERVPDGLPALLDYRTYVETRSHYNTPPVFAIYLVMLVTRWLLNDIGGLEKMAAINQRKAQILYDVLDANGELYRGHAEPDSRSLMNVTFRLPNEDLERRFLKQARERGLHELGGHRSVGGIRASIYNAMPVEGVEALREFMEEFEERR